MVDQKKILDDLKKYNKDLEKHIPGLDLDLVKEVSLFKPVENEADYLTLFAKNMLDLRTEMALMRKNLSTDVEGMVTRVVDDQQKRFETRMNDFFVKAVLETKENWERHIIAFSDEMASMKKIVAGIKSSNETVESAVTDLSAELELIKTQIALLNDTSWASQIQKKIENVDKSVLGLEKQVKANKKLETTLIKIGKEISSNPKTEEQAEELVEKVEAQVEVQSEVEEALFVEVEKPVPKGRSKKLSKILEIDRRLSKLDALR